MAMTAQPRRPASADLVDVFDLAETGSTRAGSYTLAQLPRLAAEQAGRPADSAAGAPIAFALTGFIDDRGRPSARLQFGGQIDLACDRCGEPLRWALGGQARYFFVATEPELAQLPVDEAEEEPLLGSARFDLRNLLEDEALLALPMSPRHDHCRPPAERRPRAAGVDEAVLERPHPFAALEKLRSRRH
jgi:uncharacterized protein